MFTFAKSISMPWLHNNMTLERFIEEEKTSSDSDLDDYAVYYLANTANVRKYFNIPLLRDLPEDRL